MIQQFADDLAEACITNLRHDPTWKDGLTPDESEALLTKGLQEFLRLRLLRADIEYGDQNWRAKMALEVISCIFQRVESIR